MNIEQFLSVTQGEKMTEEATNGASWMQEMWLSALNVSATGIQIW